VKRDPEFSSGQNWQSWMKDFRFGTLVFIPTGDLRQTADVLREQFDPTSARTSAAHITLTQPLATAPTDADLEQIEQVISSLTRFNIQIGPATTSPNKKLLWLDVNPKDPILALRENLHRESFFRTDLPLTKGFIPHLTISELPRDDKEVIAINKDLNSKISTWNILFSSVVWIVPDENFIFRETRIFQLKT